MIGVIVRGMKQTSLLFTLCLLAVSTPAFAGGQAGSIGVGAEYQLNGIGGASVNYDAGRFHVGGFFGYQDPGGAPPYELDIGARFFFHLHQTAMADFSIGGGFGIASLRPMGDPNRVTDVFLEPGFQIRMFVASNVALSFTGGIVIGTADASGVAITGQPTGIAGVHYYFF